ncbi:Stringent starvation protein B [Rhabdaerophilaceae bacterium]
MTDHTSEDLIRYDVMVQQALIGVVRKVLTDAGKHGLPGEHHFYISFRTDAPGVRISSRLKEKHPEEMTIVLQHQFWDLVVTDHAFEIGLSFGGVPERLLVPFDAMTGFFDPSVQFGLKFAVDEAMADNDLGENDAAAPSAKSTLKAISALEQSTKGKASQQNPADGAEPAKPAPVKRPRKPTAKPGTVPPPADVDAVPPVDATTPPAAGAEVVSLDSFRKKK